MPTGFAYEEVALAPTDYVRNGALPQEDSFDFW
jgi:hypothetical protein